MVKDFSHRVSILVGRIVTRQMLQNMQLSPGHHDRPGFPGCLRPFGPFQNSNVH
ncbi:hypothetical protein D3C78_1860410 [compost metagenome]